MAFACKEAPEDTPPVQEDGVEVQSDIAEGAVTLFNDRSTEALPLVLEDGVGRVVLPKGVTQLYALYPFVANPGSGPANAVVRLARSQERSGLGEAPLKACPRYAQASVREGEPISLHFAPLCATLKIDVCAPPAAGEKLKAVSFSTAKPQSLCGAGIVDLTSERPRYLSGDEKYAALEAVLEAPAAIPSTASGSDAGRLFLYLPCQRFTAITLTVSTDKARYTLLLPDDFELDLSGAESRYVRVSLASGRLQLEGGPEVECTRRTVEPGDFSSLGQIPPRDTLSVDIIPDYSRVGYKYGDAAIPDLPVKRTVTVADVAAVIAANPQLDTTSYLQSVIDEVGSSGGGAVLLKNGVYNVAGTLFIDFDNSVLRGESEAGAVINARGHGRRVVLALGRSIEGRKLNVEKQQTMDVFKNIIIMETLRPATPAREVDFNTQTSVIEDFVPVGRMWVRVANPENFNPGDRVVVVRPGTDQWVSDIGMDKVANGSGELIGEIAPWTPSAYDLTYERIVTAVNGDRIYFEAPLVQALYKEYGGGYVARCSFDRIHGSGVENLTVDSTFDGTLLSTNNLYTETGKKYCYDENHAWNGVTVSAAEDCWVRHFTCRHYAQSVVYFQRGARRCTAEYCTGLDPISIVRGYRRYAYYYGSGPELCLVQHSSCDHDRHCCVTGKAFGPNVFYDVTCTRTHEVVGPHMSWCTGTLYDSIWTDYGFQSIDRGNYGNGHGWAGANQVFWNCTATGSYGIAAQSPWVSARNYVVGCVGYRNPGRKDYGQYSEDYYEAQGLSRPEAEWYPERAIGSTGGSKVSLPLAVPPRDWWPRFQISSFSTPESLYACQLEDRHARGIWLNNL